MEKTSEVLADFASGARLDSVPEAVVRKAKLSILDGIGTALVSSRLEKSRQTARAIKSVSTNGKSVAWGFGFRASALETALLNGMLIEGLDYSDIHVAAGLHPTSVILPAITSCAESRGTGGDEVLLSHVIGCETMVRLGLSASGKFHARGFQPTSIVGVVGAAVAASRVMNLPVAQMRQAISLGTALAFGSSLSVRVGAYFGGIDTGRAAESGILAALLAREGVSGIATDAIEGRFGFLEAHAGAGNYDLGPITKGLGKTWEMKDIFLKRYPTSYACTFMLDAALRLRKSTDLSADQVEEVRFGDSAQNIGLFSEPEEQKRRPATIYDAKTSHYFLLSLALIYGTITPQMLQTKLSDRRVQQLSDKVSYVLDTESHWVEVRLKGGSVVRETQDTLVPTAEEVVRKKYRENAGQVLGAEKSAKIESMVDGLERIGDIRELTALLRKGSAAQV
ncbi:MAG: MmgE/PrpD family protein [Thaumarchaeota archaeon]|nr:MmgE/PrpD family protein [Nitrososphaerota archaeon]